MFEKHKISDSFKAALREVADGKTSALRTDLNYRQGMREFDKAKASGMISETKEEIDEGCGKNEGGTHTNSNTVSHKKVGDKETHKVKTAPKKVVGEETVEDETELTEEQQAELEAVLVEEIEYLLKEGFSEQEVFDIITNSLNESESDVEKE